jgi:hypothetical protein
LVFTGSIYALFALAFVDFSLLTRLPGLGVAYLYKQHSTALATAALADYEVDAQWAPLACPEHLLLCRLLQPPASAGLPVQRDAAVMAKLLDFFCTVHMGKYTGCLAMMSYLVIPRTVHCGCFLKPSPAQACSQSVALLTPDLYYRHDQECL